MYFMHCVLVADDHARGLTTFTILAGFGGFIGYLLGSIDWTQINIFGKLTPFSLPCFTWGIFYIARYSCRFFPRFVIQWAYTSILHDDDSDVYNLYIDHDNYFQRSPLASYRADRYVP